MPHAPTPAESLSAGPRILIVSPQPFYQDRGTPIAVGQLAAALSALGFPVDLLAYPIGRPIQIPGVRLVRGTNPFRFRDVRIGFSLRKLLLDAGMLGPLRSLLRTERYAAVHVLEEMTWPVLLMCRNAGMPVIYDMQSSLPDQLRTHAVFRPGWVQRLLRRLEDWALHRASAIVCAAGLLRHVRSRAPHATAYEWKWPGQDRDLSAQPDKLRARLGIAADRRVVMYAGTLEPYQGIDMFLEAMAAVTGAFPEAVAVLVGATPGDDVDANAHAARLAGEGRLLVLPRQPRESIPAYLGMADILVSPRAYGDNVPLKIFDYLMSGKPIVATDIAAHRSILDADTAALVECSPSGIAAGVCGLLADPGRSSAIAAAAFARASAAPGKGAYIDLVETLYAAALEQSRLPSRARRTRAR